MLGLLVIIGFIVVMVVVAAIVAIKAGPLEYGDEGDLLGGTRDGDVMRAGVDLFPGANPFLRTTSTASPNPIKIVNNSSDTVYVTSNGVTTEISQMQPVFSSRQDSELISRLQKELKDAYVLHVLVRDFCEKPTEKKITHIRKMLGVK